MSVGLIISVIAAIAVVLALVIDTDDDKAVTTNVNDAPLSYYVPEAGEGIFGGRDQEGFPALQAHTGERQGDGLATTADDPTAIEPTTRYRPYGGDIGFIDGSDSSTAMEQAQRAHDEMLFEEWNDPLGWQATSEQEAVVPRERQLFLEANGVYETTRNLAVIRETPEVIPYERQKFLEDNIYLPGWTADTSTGDIEGFTEN